MMDCTFFEKHLDGFVQETIAQATRSAMQEHLACCNRCRRLFDISRGEPDVMPFETGEILARSILEKTSGIPCPRVRQHLCDFTDGLLGTEYARLVSLHLDHCPACQGLARLLGELSQELPQMSERDPGAGFTAQVLKVTAQERASRPSLATRIRERWERALRRPRFPFEAAYAGTLLVILTLGTPTIPPLDGSTRVLAPVETQLRRTLGNQLAGYELPNLTRPIRTKLEQVSILTSRLAGLETQLKDTLASQRSSAIRHLSSLPNLFFRRAFSFVNELIQDFKQAFSKE